MAKSVHDLINERFGVRARTDINPDGVISVGAAAAVIARANPMRYAIIFVNLDPAGNIFILPSGIPTTTRGIQVPAGGFIGFNYMDDFVMPAQEWQAISDIAAAELLIITVEGEPD